MYPIIALAIALAAAVVVALVADRLGTLRTLLRTRPAFAVSVSLGLIAGAAATPLLGCASSPEARARQQQTLAAVVSRVDVARLLECSKHGISREAARCLGARALTEGLEEAVLQATTLAENAQEAANPRAGAADMDADQEAVLAADLDIALDRLAVEIAGANALADAQSALD
ncbi:MAG: hypothetical protein ACE37F_14245 [Nannocystaceae bacterium]|nr:hypothetical protein [bacterium]